ARLSEPVPQGRSWPRAAALGAVLFCGVVFLTAASLDRREGDASREIAGGSVALDASVQAKHRPQVPQGQDVSSHGTPFRTNRSAQDHSNSSLRLRPVVFFHGAAQGAGEFESMRQWIERRHP
ncbi:ZRANB3, partial [Symbiodinium natans]